MFVATPSTKINVQSLQLEMWFIFNLKNDIVKYSFECYNGYYMSNVWHKSHISETRCFSKLSHVSGYAPAMFCVERIGCAPKRPTQTSCFWKACSSKSYEVKKILKNKQLRINYLSFEVVFRHFIKKATLYYNA